MNLLKASRSKDTVFTGVAGGIAKHQNLPVKQVRTMWIVAAMLTSRIAFIPYVALSFIMPPPSGFNINDFRAQ